MNEATLNEIFKIGRSLEEIGVKNWGLTESQAFLVLKELLLSNIPVLGGDVYILRDGRLEHCYDSWYCNREAGENSNDFAKRSILKSESYIKSYKGEKINKLFALVIDF